MFYETKNLMRLKTDINMYIVPYTDAQMAVVRLEIRDYNSKKTWIILYELKNEN